jgi:hypothetical protein
MKKLIFTSGTIKTYSDKLFLLELFNNDKLVYSANLNLDEFMKVTTKHRTIKIILNPIN